MAVSVAAIGLIIVWIMIIVFIYWLMRKIDKPVHKMRCPYCKEMVSPVFNTMYSTPPGVMLDMRMIVWGCPNCGKIIDEDFF